MIMGAIALGRGILEHGYTMPSAVGGLGLGVMAGALTLPHDGTEALYTVVGVGDPRARPPPQPDRRRISLPRLRAGRREAYLPAMASTCIISFTKASRCATPPRGG